MPTQKLLFLLLCLFTQVAQAQPTFNARNQLAMSGGAAFVRPAYLTVVTTDSTVDFLPGKTSSPEAQKALAMLWRDEVDSSIAYLNLSLQHKKSKELYEIRAMCYQQLLETEKALEDYKNALSIAPDDTTYQAIAHSYYDLINHVEALQWTKEGLRRYPNSVPLWLMLAKITYETADDWRDALPLYRKTAELEGTGRFYNMAGGACWNKGDRQCAVEHLTMAINAAPETAFYYSRRAEVYMEADKYAEAVTDLEKVVEIEPESAGYWHDLAKAYYENREETKKKEALKRAAALGYECECRIHRDQYEF